MSYLSATNVVFAPSDCIVNTYRTIQSSSAGGSFDCLEERPRSSRRDLTTPPTARLRAMPRIGINDFGTPRVRPAPRNDRDQPDLKLKPWCTRRLYLPVVADRMKQEYAYVWEYIIKPGRMTDFETAYGPEGTWVQLFRRADGYVRTELLRDRRDPNRFVTIDFWQSASHWESFRALFSDDFEQLDAECEELTSSETEIGRFDPVGLG